MNQEALEGRLLAHRRILQLFVSELAGGVPGERVEAPLRERSTLQDGQEDPGAVETSGMGVELDVAEEFRRVTARLIRSVAPMEHAPEEWDEVDEASDEWFPASGPPARG